LEIICIESDFYVSAEGIMSDKMMCWPQWMSIPRKNNYSYELADRTIESPMEIGTFKRVEFDTDETTISCTLILCNRLQLEWFEKFERDCLRQGSKWFRMPIYMSGYVDWYTVQIKGRPKFGGLIGISHTTVTLQVRIEKRDLMDDDVFEIITMLGPDFAPSIFGVTKPIFLSGVTNSHDDTWEWWREFDAGIAFAVPNFAGITNGPSGL
jgi:hypothetical protein